MFGKLALSLKAKVFVARTNIILYFLFYASQLLDALKTLFVLNLLSDNIIRVLSIENAGELIKCLIK